MEIPSNWIIETEKIIDIQNTWLRHENSYTIYGKQEISEFLKRNKHCIFLISTEDIEKIAFFVYSVIYKFYRRNYDLLRKGYEIKKHYWFILEEAQNSLDRFVLSKRLFNRYRKLFSEARNLNLHWILITQRLQDLSTYFRARTSLAIGKIGLDDFDLKLKRLLKPIPQARQKILNLPRGTFFFTAINDFVEFPKFNPSKPKEFKPTKPQKKPKKSTIWKILNYFGISREESEEEAPEIGEAPEIEPFADSDHPESESEIEIDESEEYPDEW